MNKTDKILVSFVAGIAIGAVMGILFTKESDCSRKVQNIKNKLQRQVKKHTKPASMKEEFEQAVKEAFAENPEEYA